MPKYERTRICGCGECRFKPLSSGPCPKEKEKGAIWLFRTVYGSEDEVAETSEDSGEVILDTPSVVGETVEVITM